MPLAYLLCRVPNIRKWAAVRQPKSREETPEKGVPAKHKEAIEQMHGVPLPRNALSSLNYLHESSRFGAIPARASEGTRGAREGAPGVGSQNARFMRSWHVGVGPDVHDQTI
jgi:hypothetical protein